MAKGKDNISIQKDRLVVATNEALYQKMQWMAVIIGMLVYINTLLNSFVLDDVAVIGINRLVQQGFEGIPKLLTTGLLYGYNGSNSGTYRPIAMVTFAMEAGLHGASVKQAWMFHLTNIFLYGTLLLVVFRFIFVLFKDYSNPIKFLIVLLFALHPIHTEVVANIKSRDEIMCMLFGIISILNIMKYMDTKNILFLLLAIVNLVIAFLSKETAISFLVIAPFLMIYKYGFDIKKVLLPSIIAVVATFVVYAIIKIALFGSITNLDSKNVIDLIDNYLNYLDFPSRIASALFIYFLYLKLLVLPYPLSYDYSFNYVGQKSFGDIQVIFFIALTLLSIYYLIKNIRKMDMISLGIIIFFASSIVTSNLILIIGSAMAERFMFIPSLGFIMIVIGLFDKIIKKDKENFQSAMYYPIYGVCIIFAVMVFNRNKAWKDNITLYKTDIKHSNKSARINYSVGNELWRMSERTEDKLAKNAYLTEAVGYLESAMKIYPDYADALFTLGNVYHDLGDYDKEIALMAKQEKAGKTNNMMFYNAGNAKLEKGDFAGAIKMYRTALDMTPNNVEPYVNMGSAYLQMGNIDSAVFCLEKAISINPNYPQAYINLGTAYFSLKNKEKAIINIQKSLELDPKSVEANVVLGNYYLSEKNMDKALFYLEKGYQLNPNYAVGVYNYGVALVGNKEYQKAIPIFKQAINVNPNYLEAIMNVGYCHLSLGNYDESILYYEKVVQLAPQYKQAYQSLAFIYGKKGDKEKAKEYQLKGK